MKFSLRGMTIQTYLNTYSVTERRSYSEWSHILTLKLPYLFKGEFVTMHAIKAPGGSKCLAPSILNLVTRSMTVVTLTLLSP